MAWSIWLKTQRSRGDIPYPVSSLFGLGVARAYPQTGTSGRPLVFQAACHNRSPPLGLVPRDPPAGACKVYGETESLSIVTIPVYKFRRSPTAGLVCFPFPLPWRFGMQMFEIFYVVVCISGRWSLFDHVVGKKLTFALAVCFFLP